MSATILVVEDDTIIQGLVETALRKAGHDVLLVGSGSEMFDALAGGQAIDLILLDLGLPDGDAMPHIMDIREKSEIPIVIITARGRQDDRLMALGLGADDYLTKPIDIRELALRVGNILARNRGKPRPSLEGLVGDTPRATPMPATRSKPKKKREISMGAVVGVLMLALIAGGGVYLGLIGGVLDSPAPQQTAVVPEPQPEQQSKPVAGPTSESGSSSTSESASDAADEASLDQVQQPESSAQVTVELPPKSDGGGIETATTETTTATIVTIPGPDGTAVDKADGKAKPGKTSTAPSTTLPKAFVLGYGWVLDTTCPPLPEVSWWTQQSHEEMAHHVVRKLKGDWQAYIDNLTSQLATMYDIAERDSAAVTRTGERLEGAALQTYIEQSIERLKVVRCLAEEADQAKTTQP